MWKDWWKMLQARNWMHRNRGFLPCWHAYVGYKFDLFARLRAPESVESFLAASNLDRELLQNWLDVGLALGHLKRVGGRKPSVQASRGMLRSFARDSDLAVGELLVEMMELHVPSLLHYPEMMTAGKRRSYDAAAYAQTVAHTSSYVEEAAFSSLYKWVKKHHCRSIVDVGCGYAGYLLRLARKDAQLNLIGIEKQATLCEAARAAVDRANFSGIRVLEEDFLQASDESLAASLRAEDAVDMVMMNNILYYFSPEQRPQLYARAANLLPHGGSLTMISPLRPQEAGQMFAAAFNSFMSAHENLFGLPSLAEIESQTHAVGFRLETMEPVIREGHWYFFGLTKT
jgi:SAM-dependent methyltransferase